VGADLVMLAAARHARELRRRAARLAYAAETVAEREPCRDVAPERDRLRGAAAHAEQRAQLLEAVVGGS
jgi:hypothetical protein